MLPLAKFGCNFSAIETSLLIALAINLTPVKSDDGADIVQAGIGLDRYMLYWQPGTAFITIQTE